MSTIPVKLLSAPERRRRRGIITMGVLGVFGLITFGILPKSDQSVTFGFVLGNEWILAREWVVSAKAGAIVFAILAAERFNPAWLCAIRAITNTTGVTFNDVASSWMSDNKAVSLMTLISILDKSDRSPLESFVGS